MLRRTHIFLAASCAIVGSGLGASSAGASTSVPPVGVGLATFQIEKYEPSTVHATFNGEFLVNGQLESGTFALQCYHYVVTYCDAPIVGSIGGQSLSGTCSISWSFPTDLIEGLVPALPEVGTFPIFLAAGLVTTSCDGTLGGTGFSATLTSVVAGTATGVDTVYDVAGPFIG